MANRKPPEVWQTAFGQARADVVIVNKMLEQIYAIVYHVYNDTYKDADKEIVYDKTWVTHFDSKKNLLTVYQAETRWLEKLAALLPEFKHNKGAGKLTLQL